MFMVGPTFFSSPAGGTECYSFVYEFRGEEAYGEIGYSTTPSWVSPNCSFRVRVAPSYDVELVSITLSSMLNFCIDVQTQLAAYGFSCFFVDSPTFDFPNRTLLVLNCPVPWILDDGDLSGFNGPFDYDIFYTEIENNSGPAFEGGFINFGEIIQQNTCYVPLPFPVTCVPTLTAMGTVGIQKSSNTVATSGVYAYVGVYTTGAVQIIDCTNKSTPVLVNTFATFGPLNEVAISGTHMYSCSDTSFRKYSLASPTAPALTGFINGTTGTTFNSCKALTFSDDGTKAYVTMFRLGAAGVAVIDIVPATPVIIGWVAGGVGNGVGEAIAAKHNRVYHIGFNNKLSVYNVTSPTSPVYVGAVSTDYLSNDLTIDAAGNWLYVAVFNHARVYSYDLSDPDVPSLWDLQFIGDSPTAVLTKDNYLYTLVQSSPSSELALFDASTTGGAGPTFMESLPIAVSTMMAMKFLQSQYIVIPGYAPLGAPPTTIPSGHTYYTFTFNIISGGVLGSGYFVGPINPPGNVWTLADITVFSFTYSDGGPPITISKANLTEFSQFNLITRNWDPVIPDSSDSVSWFTFYSGAAEVSAFVFSLGFTISSPDKLYIYDTGCP